jgi:hypothetical protein
MAGAGLGLNLIAILLITALVFLQSLLQNSAAAAGDQ